MKCIGAQPLAEVQQYDGLNVAIQLKYVTKQPSMMYVKIVRSGMFIMQ